MSRSRRRRMAWWAGLLTVGLIGGCGGLSRRPAGSGAHAPTNLLDTGPTPKVTSQGAADIQFAIGRSHEEGNKLPEAEAAYRAALTKNARRADIETRLAIVLDREGKPQEADQHFDRALKLDPKNADLLCDRGYSLYLRGKTAEAEKSLRGALALVPQHARGHTNLGLVLAARGETEAAMVEFTRAGTDTGDSRANLALALALGGQVGAARDQYAQALAAKPGSPAATQGLKVAATVLQKNAASLPGLPGAAAPAAVASSASVGTMQIDPAVVPTALAR